MHHWRTWMLPVMGLSAMMMAGCQQTVKPTMGVDPSTSLTARSALTDPRAFLFEHRIKAGEQVLASARSSDASLRANALEAAMDLPEHAGELLSAGMKDENQAVRFVALTVMGKLRLSSLVPEARVHVRSENESVRAAALFALRRCGVKVDISPMAGMLASPSATTRGNIAMLLGLMGEPSAIPMLRELAQVNLPRASPAQERIVRLQIIEAMLRLGDDTVIDAMRAYAAYAPEDEIRVAAVMMVGELNDRRFEKAIEPLVESPPMELQLAAAGTLARFGREDGLSVAMKAAEASSPMQRTQAALTLGLFKNVVAARQLTKMLNDPEEVVRLAAASAILKYGGGRAG